MNSNASSDIQTIVTDVLNSRPYTHRQDVDMSVAAVITAQHDLRFRASTVGAVLAQRMLPGMIVIADCTGQIEQPMQMTFDVIHSSQDVLTEVPEAKTVRVILVGVKQAASFMDAVTRAMDQIGIDAGIRALWTLHDDSRPADDRCFGDVAGCVEKHADSRAARCQAVGLAGEEPAQCGFVCRAP